ncbi:MAG TPA: XdhC family protein [Blastocatellia bacterium]|nr:XdhC family protein [Blastocatellia bacterium]
MAEPNHLLEIIEDRAALGEQIVVARVLYPESGKTVSVTVSGDEISPPIADGRLTASVLEAVGSLATKGGVADLIDAVDQEGTAVRLAVEIIKPKLELIVFGAGHVGQAVAMIGALLGYRVIAVDDREEFASRKRLPDPRIDLLVSDYASATRKLSISPSTAVVIVTRGHQYDELCLKNVINSNAGYIGMIGSRRRVVSVFKKLAGEGISEAAFERVHAPIGLRIGARSPQEIAVSILAEIIGHVNNPEHKHKGE